MLNAALRAVFNVHKKVVLSISKVHPLNFMINVQLFNAYYIQPLGLCLAKPL